MGKQWEKYILKLNPSQRQHIRGILIQIRTWKREWLDIVPMKWNDLMWRCRTWKYRILFEKRWNTYVPVKILPRWDIYK